MIWYRDDSPMPSRAQISMSTCLVLAVEPGNFPFLIQAQFSGGASHVFLIRSPPAPGFDNCHSTLLFSFNANRATEDPRSSQDYRF